jgi:hypothetical protein
MQRAGRIGTDELDQHFALAAGRRATVVVALGQHFAHDHAQVVRAGIEIQEAGAGDLDLFDPLGGRQAVANAFGQIARVHAGALGQTMAMLQA